MVRFSLAEIEDELCESLFRACRDTPPPQRVATFSQQPSPWSDADARTPFAGCCSPSNEARGNNKALQVHLVYCAANDRTPSTAGSSATTTDANTIPRVSSPARSISWYPLTFQSPPPSDSAARSGLTIDPSPTNRTAIFTRGWIASETISRAAARLGASTVSRKA